MYDFCINVEAIIGFLSYMVYYSIMEKIKSDGTHKNIPFESTKELKR